MTVMAEDLDERLDETVERDATEVLIEVYTSGTRGQLASRWAFTVLGAVVLLVAFATLVELPPASLAAWAALSLFLPALSLVDHKTMYLPNALIHPAALVSFGAGALTAALTGASMDLLWALATAAATFTAFFLIWFVAPAGAFGFGDVRLSALLAFPLAFISPWIVVVGLAVIPPFVALCFAIPAAIRGKGNTSPYGPSMIAGAVLAALIHPYLTVF